MEEKIRRSLRYDIPLEVKFKRPKDRNEYSSGITKNFSRKGLCFETKVTDSVSKGIFELSLKRPKGNTFVPVKGDIIWTRQVGAKRLFGVKLIEIDKDAKWEILDWSYNKWLDKMRYKNTGEKAAYV